MNKFFKSALCVGLAMFIVQTGFACTNVLVTKGASKDGSILITYSADSHQLYGELCVALDLEREEVPSYIREVLASAS